MTYYYIPTDSGYRMRVDGLRRAYQTAAHILYGMYLRYGRDIYKGVPEYHGSTGLPIYRSPTGRSASNWVRFSNGTDPSRGWEKVSYTFAMGVRTDGSYPFSPGRR